MYVHYHRSGSLSPFPSAIFLSGLRSLHVSELMLYFSGQSVLIIAVLQVVDVIKIDIDEGSYRYHDIDVIRLFDSFLSKPQLARKLRLS